MKKFRIFGPPKYILTLKRLLPARFQWFSFSVKKDQCVTQKMFSNTIRYCNSDDNLDNINVNNSMNHSLLCYEPFLRVLGTLPKRVRNQNCDL